MMRYPDNVYAAGAQFLQMKYAVLPSPTGARYPALMNWPGIAERQTYKSGLGMLRGHAGNLTLVNRGKQKAIDIDNRPLFDYCRHYMPDAWQFSTPNGGRLAFRSNIRDRDMKRFSTPGVIEWKGQGDAFIAPPSVDIHGNRYEDLTPRLLRWYDDLPGAVIEAFKDAATAAGRDTSPATTTTTTNNERHAADDADDEALEITAGQWPRSAVLFMTQPPADGQRNTALFRAALHSHWAGFTDDEIMATLGPTAYAIDLDTKEITATIRSACRYSPPTDPALIDYCRQWIAANDYSGRQGGALWATAAACANIAMLANTTAGVALPVRRVAIFASISKNTASKHLHTLQQQGSITPTTTATNNIPNIIPTTSPTTTTTNVITNTATATTTTRFTVNSKGKLTTTTTKRHDDAHVYDLANTQLPPPQQQQNTGTTGGSPCLSVPTKSLKNTCPPADMLLAAHDAANMRAIGKRGMQLLAVLATGPHTASEAAAKMGTRREYLQRMMTVSKSGKVGKLARYVVPVGDGRYELAVDIQHMRADLDSEAALHGYRGHNQLRRLVYMNESATWKARKPDNKRIAEKKRGGRKHDTNRNT